jgi:hypothetical protein
VSQVWETGFFCPKISVFFPVFSCFLSHGFDAKYSRMTAKHICADPKQIYVDLKQICVDPKHIYADLNRICADPDRNCSRINRRCTVKTSRVSGSNSGLSIFYIKLLKTVSIMPGTDYIPKPYPALGSWLANLVSVTRADQTRFEIPPGKVDALEVAADEYSAANAAAESPAANRIDRQLRKEKAVTAKRAARGFVNLYLRYNPNVTNEDRIALGLTVPDDHPTQKTVTGSHPVITADTSTLLHVKLHLRDSAIQKSHAKPQGVHGCEIVWAILDAPPTDTEDLTHSAFTTKATYDFEFGEKQRGQHLFFRGRWENNRGEKGPWGEIGNSIIP